MVALNSIRCNGGKIIINIVSSVLLLTLISTQAYAQSPVTLSVVAGNAKGGNKFAVVVKDTPGTKLEMYINGKNPTKATTNKNAVATFNNVTLTGTGKLTFTMTGKNGKQVPVNYVRRYTFKNGKVSFTSYTTVAKPSASTRKVQGKAVTLGAGTFTGGKDVAVGLYNVTTAAGQSGNFIVTGKDSYDEILGTDTSLDEVPTLTVSLSKGDVIELSGISQVTMTPKN